MAIQIQALLISFLFTFLSEVADKTQLIILGIALKYKSPTKVFLGALSAHFIMDAVAIFIGIYFGILIISFVKYAVGAIFILLGIWQISKIHFIKGKKKEREIPKKGAFVASFLTILISEFGDKTQITAGLLAAKYQLPIQILIGAIAALALAIGLNVFIGSKIAEKLPRKWIKIATALLFVTFGILTLI